MLLSLSLVFALSRSLVLGALLLHSFALNAADLDPYPVSIDGLERQIIHLPKVVDDERFMVEVIAGRNQLADCNQRSYLGRLKHETLAGWGYSYYTLVEPTPGPTTLKACPKGSEARRFIRVRGEGFLLPYNSKLPLVIYAPPGFQVKYRVWRADKTMSDARRG